MDCSSLPPLLLRTAAIQLDGLAYSNGVRFGDVLLSRSGDKDSQMIQYLGGGNYSHAAFFVSSNLLFESDGKIVGNKLVRNLGWARRGAEEIRVAEVPGNPVEFAVYRHPGMVGVSPEQFNAAVDAEMQVSYGLEYSPLRRLAPLANVPGLVRPIVERIANLLDRWSGEKRLKGPFCSELVARVFERLALRLFATPPPRDAAGVSVAALETSFLELQPDVTVRREELGSLRPSDAFGLEGLLGYSSEGDRHAQEWQDMRHLSKSLDEAEAVLARLTQRNRKA